MHKVSKSQNLPADRADSGHEAISQTRVVEVLDDLEHGCEVLVAESAAGAGRVELAGQPRERERGPGGTRVLEAQQHVLEHVVELEQRREVVPSIGSPLSWSIVEFAEPAPITSSSAERSTPARRPTTSACASVAQLTALTAFESTLTCWPAPTSPTCTMISPIAFSSGIARSRSASPPPAMIVSVPSSAFGAEPVTGASTKPWPRSASAPPIRRASTGPIVDMSMNSVPGSAPAAAPSSPSSISSTCAPSTTIVITTSLRSPTSRGDAATCPPCSAAHSSARSRVRLKTVSS